MQFVKALTSVLFATAVFSAVYSYFYSFTEPNVELTIPPKETIELCINNSSKVFDLWNNRYLHIESNIPYYNLYSKKSFVINYINNKRVSELIFKEENSDNYSANVRLYFSQCYLIENSSDNQDLFIHATTYRSFCTLNVILMFILFGVLVYDWKVIRNEAVFFGLCIVAFFVMAASMITYISLFPKLLPGMVEIRSSLLITSFRLTYYTVFIAAIFSFILRVALNYYHFSISQMHKIPRVLSVIGPFVCQYHQWVIGTYLAGAIFVLPLNGELIWIVAVLGAILVGLLLFYGSSMAMYNLSSGVIVALVFLICVPIFVALGYQKVLSSEKTSSKKND